MDVKPSPSIISPALTLIVPIIIIVLPILGGLGGEELLKHLVYSEYGVVENLTALLLLFAVLSGVLCLRYKPFPSVKFLWPWLALFTLGCFYFMGEEISWGQTYFHWGTPETWQEINDQAETNLHNIGGLFDQFPRAVLSIGVGVGGILLPLLIRFNKLQITRGTFWAWIIPSFELLPLAVMVTLIALPAKIAKAFNIDAPDSITFGLGETKECLLALFLFLYALAILRNISRTAR